MEQYGEFERLLSEKKGYTDLEDRKRFATYAFDITSDYDASIYGYFSSGRPDASLKVSSRKSIPLRYGENPHQEGRFSGNLGEVLNVLGGKEISYNNILDIDAAINLVRDFGTEKPVFAILKHNNACGLAIRDNLAEAYRDALQGDPLSAFGGILISNREIDEETATEANKLFFEVMLAPAYSGNALGILSQKKNRILIEVSRKAFPALTVRSALNGYLVQERDSIADRIQSFRPVTVKKADAAQNADLEFANIIAKHTKSNTIVLARNLQLIGSGTGQTSRVDALRQAIGKADAYGFGTKGAVMASDAFFPFPDCVEIAHKAGIAAVVQPGGSVKDELSINYCNEHDLAMVFTGNRHFKH